MQLKENTYFGEGNRYYLERLLGRGGFSEVWLVKDSITELQLALKVYAPGTGMDEDGLKTFSKELAHVYNLNHTNLLKPQHVDSWQGMPYLVMSFCPNGSLVKQIGKMNEADIWKVIHDVAAGLAYLHERDIIHQDIKPDNVLIDEMGNYVVTDFGISTRARSTLRKSVASSTTSAGTIAYMGPERFTKDPTPLKASDIWSLGAMIYELITGDTPFGEHGGVIQKAGAEIPDIKANVSDSLKSVITKMLQLETWDRPTAAVLAEWAKDPHVLEQGQTDVEEIASTRLYDGGRETRRFASPTVANGETMPTSKPSSKRGKWLPILLLCICFPYTFFLNVVTLGLSAGLIRLICIASLLLFLSIDCCLITLVRAPQMRIYKVLNYLIPIGAFFLVLACYLTGIYSDIVSFVQKFNLLVL